MLAAKLQQKLVELAAKEIRVHIVFAQSDAPATTLLKVSRARGWGEGAEIGGEKHLGIYTWGLIQLGNGMCTANHFLCNAWTRPVIFLLSVKIN